MERWTFADGYDVRFERDGDDLVFPDWSNPPEHPHRPGLSPYRIFVLHSHRLLELLIQEHGPMVTS